MENKEMNEKILNKKFKKSMFSGYDAEDVDSFFDEVIQYLQKNDEHIKELNNVIINMKTKIQNLEDNNKKLNNKILVYEKNGYGQTFIRNK